MGFLPILLTAVSAAGSIAQANNQRKAAKAQEEAQQQNLRQAEKQASDAQAAQDQEFNKRNQKKPTDPAALAAMQGKTQGTLLSSPIGVDPSQLTLGKNTLLGQ